MILKVRHTHSSQPPSRDEDYAQIKKTAYCNSPALTWSSIGITSPIQNEKLAGSVGIGPTARREVRGKQCVSHTFLGASYNRSFTHSYC